MNVIRKGPSNYLTTDLVSHTRKVCSLYKLLLRNIDFDEDDFYEARFKKLQIRAEFDKHKDIKDARVAKALLEKGQKWFEENGNAYLVGGIEIHPYSKEGIAYNRGEESPDYVMDYHHPLEKARYPYYFAKREEMKREYLKVWNKKMG